MTSSKSSTSSKIRALVVLFLDKLSSSREISDKHRSAIIEYSLDELLCIFEYLDNKIPIHKYENKKTVNILEKQKISKNRSKKY